LATHAERGLGVIQTGLSKIASRAGAVKVALLPMFSSRWLSSRLGSLFENNPDFQLLIQNHNNQFARMNNPAEYADVGIQWGRGNWKNFEVTRLWPEKMVVVCSPEYLREHRIQHPSDLIKCKLLHVDDTRMWDEWYQFNELPLSGSQPQMMLEDRHFQLSSTVNGLGVSLFASWLVENELRRGVLVNPFGRTFDTSFAYHLIVPSDNDPLPAVRQFCSWLTDACEQQDQPVQPDNAQAQPIIKRGEEVEIS